MELTFEVKGLEEVKNAMVGLPDHIAKKIIRKGTFAGAKLIRDRVIVAAPIRREGQLGKPYGPKLGIGVREMRYPGFLKKHIGARYLKERSSRDQAAYGVGPLGHGFYGHFVEDGHRIGKRPAKNVIITRSDTRGSVPAHPYMEPVFKANYMDAIEVMKDEFITGANDYWDSLKFTGWD